MTENTEPTADKVAARQAAKERLAAALKKRDEDKAAAETTFWRTVDQEIRSGALRQVDATEATGFSREYIRKQIKNLPTE